MCEVVRVQGREVEIGRLVDAEMSQEAVVAVPRRDRKSLARVGGERLCQTGVRAPRQHRKEALEEGLPQAGAPQPC